MLVNDKASLCPDAKVWMYLVYLKYWTLNLMPLMVYPNVLFRMNFSINSLCRRRQPRWCTTIEARTTS